MICRTVVLLARLQARIKTIVLCVRTGDTIGIRSATERVGLSTKWRVSGAASFLAGRQPVYSHGHLILSVHDQLGQALSLRGVLKRLSRVVLGRPKRPPSKSLHGHIC
jgi:hypothetical protein